VNALDIALAYHHAWTGQDFERAMTFIADDIVCDAPAGRIEGKEQYRAFMGPFAQSLMTSELYAAYGDEDTAVVMYNTGTTVVPRAPGAEYVTVRDGRIVRSVFVFDRLPFAEARRAAG